MATMAKLYHKKNVKISSLLDYSLMKRELKTVPIASEVKIANTQIELTRKI